MSFRNPGWLSFRFKYEQSRTAFWQKDTVAFFFFFDETTPKPRFDDPALTKSLMNFFSNRSPAPINTEKRYTNFHVDKQLLTCPTVYLRVDRVKKGLENSFTEPFKVLKRFDKYFIIETFKGSSKISIDRL